MLIMAFSLTEYLKEAQFKASHGADLNISH